MSDVRTAVAHVAAGTTRATVAHDAARRRIVYVRDDVGRDWSEMIAGQEEYEYQTVVRFAAPTRAPIRIIVVY